MPSSTSKPPHPRCSTKVVTSLQLLHRLFDHLGSRHRPRYHDVVIHQFLEVLGGRLTVDETPRLDGSFVWIGTSFYNNSIVLRPLGSLLYIVTPQHIGKRGIEQFVRLELPHDLT